MTGEINGVKIDILHDNQFHISDKSVKVLVMTVLGLALIAFVCFVVFLCLQEKPVNEIISQEVPQQKIEETKISQTKVDVVSQSLKSVEENKPEADKIIVSQEIKAAATISQEPVKSSPTTTKASKTVKKKTTRTTQKRPSPASTTTQKSNVKANISQSETFHSPAKSSIKNNSAHEVIP